MTHFRVERLIGAGTFGTVEEVDVLSDDGTILQSGLAKKTLRTPFADDEEAVARFKREVRLYDELQHRNIVAVLGRNLNADPPYFLMPLAEANMAERLAEGRAGDVPWIIDVFAQILDGMAYAHTRETPVLHRDLKPLNVLFIDGVPKIADFGLGKRLAADATQLTRTDIGMGTEAYMAPEQWSAAKEVGPPADVYALGKLLWEMLAGEEPEPLHVELGAIPPEFRFFVERSTRRRAEERYPDAAEALANFRIFLEAARSAEPPTEAAEALIADWLISSEVERPQLLRRLDDHLARNANQEELFFKVVPRLPDGVLTSYLREMPDAFAAMLRVYDQHIAGALPFRYTDVVADFYARIWRSTEDLGLRRKLLERLLTMGASHNRFYVGEVVGRLLGEIDDVSTAAMAAEVVLADPTHAEWFWTPWLRERRLIAPLDNAFASITDMTS